MQFLKDGVQTVGANTVFLVMRLKSSLHTVLFRPCGQFDKGPLTIWPVFAYTLAARTLL